MNTKFIAQRPFGMTLVETAVAFGLTGLLATLAATTLSKAREDAKRLTCQSHLGQVGAALLNYHTELGVFPLFPTNGSFASWTYGGWSGRNREYWEDQAGGVWNIQTNERPLTVYMTPWEVPDEVDPFTPTQEAPLFRCPSDTVAARFQFGGSDPISAYDDTGTSYQMNFHWFGQLESCPPDEPPGCFSYKLEVLGAQIYGKYMLGEPARFITLMEDPADWGFAAGVPGGSGIQTMGFHGDFSKHMAAFAEGHVEYTYLDTRHLHDSDPNPPGPRHPGLGSYGAWTVCDENREHESGGRHL